MSICKEKFSREEQASFDLEGGPELEETEELDLVTLAKQGNYTYVMFNHIYADSTTLTMNVLLHRNYRASASWQKLFGFNSIL